MTYAYVSGKQFLNRLAELGVLPNGVTRVIIEADMRGAVRIHYALVGSGELLKLEAADVIPARVIEHK